MSRLCSISTIIFSGACTAADRLFQYIGEHKITKFYSRFTQNLSFCFLLHGLVTRGVIKCINSIANCEQTFVIVCCTYRITLTLQRYILTITIVTYVIVVDKFHRTFNCLLFSVDKFRTQHDLICSICSFNSLSNDIPHD